MFLCLDFPVCKMGIKVIPPTLSLWLQVSVESSLHCHRSPFPKGLREMRCFLPLGRALPAGWAMPFPSPPPSPATCGTLPGTHRGAR